MTRPRLLGLALALLAILLDQVSKPLLRDWLAGGGVQVTSFFNLVSAWNRGVGFSLLVMQGAAGPYILAGAALVIAGGMVVWLWRTRRLLPAAALGLIIGGALGNVIDRLRYGAVFDFLDFHLADNHFPAFNVADSSLSIGVVLLIIDGLFDGPGNSKNTARSGGVG
jgi:signal peptidase II